MGDKIVTLEYETYSSVAVVVPVGVGKRSGIRSVEINASRRAFVETSDKVEQSGLAATRMTEDADELAGTELNRYTLKNVRHLVFRQLKVLRYIF